MGKAKKTRKFAEVKRTLNPKDLQPPAKKQKTDKEDEVKQVEKVSSALFFRYNTQLGPPYQILVDTNFINFSIRNKLDLVQGMMDCLYAECFPCITDCVMAELEKLGQKYRVALKVAKDPRIERLPCTHSGTYADDCIVERVKQHKCYIVATCDRDLRRRVRKQPKHQHHSYLIVPTVAPWPQQLPRLQQPKHQHRTQSFVTPALVPGVPIMYIAAHRYTIERLPEATMGGAPRT